MDTNDDTIALSGIKRRELKNIDIDFFSLNIFGFIIIGENESAVGFSAGSIVYFVTSMKNYYYSIKDDWKDEYFRSISFDTNKGLLKLERNFGKALKGIFIGGPDNLKNEFVEENKFERTFEDVKVYIINTEEEGYKGFMELILIIKDKVFERGQFTLKSAPDEYRRSKLTLF